MLSSLAYAVGGAVASRALPQMLLGGTNEGVVGYGANLVATFVGAKVLGFFTKNKQTENAFIFGGVLSTFIRVLADMTPLGATLKQYGIGDYEASTFLSPARYVDAAKSAAVDIPTALRPAPVPIKSGMAGMGMSGTYGRGRSTY